MDFLGQCSFSGEHFVHVDCKFRDVTGITLRMNIEKCIDSDAVYYRGIPSHEHRNYSLQFHAVTLFMTYYYQNNITNSKLLAYDIKSIAYMNIVRGE